MTDLSEKLEDSRHYLVSAEMDEELKRRFTYHAPQDGQPERYTMIRDEAYELAKLIIHATPSSKEQSTALTKLEEAVMWANAAIARNEA